MKGFLSSVLGVAILLLILKIYTAWIDTSELDLSFSSYIKTINDVYKRAELEDRVYDFLIDNALHCKTLLATGKISLDACQESINRKFTDLLSSNNIVQSCDNPLTVVLTPTSLKVVISCPVEGNIGEALFKIPVGAGVEV